MQCPGLEMRISVVAALKRSIRVIVCSDGQRGREVAMFASSFAVMGNANVATSQCAVLPFCTRHQQAMRLNVTMSVSGKAHSRCPLLKQHISVIFCSIRCRERHDLPN
eukprot:1956256-Rhodomonas_salina.2